ncbi:MAG: hypothetical protein JXA94_06435 [Parachlamydiales bacterium]|nr:hypothetical protein [Parachlamydiales bacterium]
MKNFIRYIIFLPLIIFSSVFAQDLENEGKQEDPDMQALEKWIRQKRLITLKEIGGDLSLSGEVRVEFQGFNERKNGTEQRGSSSVSQKPDYAFDVEVNLMFDYQTDRTWASVKLEFDNDMGTESGTTNKIALERAYLGGRIVDGETFNLDAELGRRNLNSVFESKIQFSSIFDGGLLKFNKAFESIGNFYVNTGVFLINDLYNHYGEVAELGMLRVGNTGFFLKYSIINWKKSYSDPIKNRIYDFLNSQVTLGYQGTVNRFNKYIKIYAAGLINHFANDLKLSDKSYNKKYNLAAYVGVSYGKILQAGDWAVDVNLQYVMPQAIPDFDCGGIKRGNIEKVGLYTQNINGTGAPTSSKTAVGNENYKGFQFEALYAITANLTLLQNFEISNNQTFDVGPSMSYKKYEMEFIYAF